MENIMRVITEAVETLEEYLTDLPECIENETERRRVVSVVNRVLRIGTVTKKELENEAQRSGNRS